MYNKKHKVLYTLCRLNDVNSPRYDDVEGGEAFSWFL